MKKKEILNVEDLVEYAQSKYGVKYQTQFIMKRSNLYIAEINNALMGPLEFLKKKVGIVVHLSYI